MDAMARFKIIFSNSDEIERDKLFGYIGDLINEFTPISREKTILVSFLGAKDMVYLM